MSEGIAEGSLQNLHVKQLHHIFDATLALKSDVDEIVIVVDYLLSREPSS